MKTLTLNYYQDPGHGWVKVKLSTLQNLNIADQIRNRSEELTKRPRGYNVQRPHN